MFEGPLFQVGTFVDRASCQEMSALGENLIEHLVARVAAVGDEDDLVHREAGLRHFLDDEGISGLIIDRALIEVRVEELSSHLIHDDGKIDLRNPFVLFGVPIGGVLDGGGITRDRSAVEGAVSNLVALL